MEDSSRTERVTSITEQLEFERRTIYDSFNKLPMPLGLPTPKRAKP